MQFFFSDSESVESSKQKFLEAEALNFRLLINCLNQENLNKLMEAKSLSVYKLYVKVPMSTHRFRSSDWSIF